MPIKVEFWSEEGPRGKDFAIAVEVAKQIYEILSSRINKMRGDGQKWEPEQVILGYYASYLMLTWDRNAALMPEEEKELIERMQSMVHKIARGVMEEKDSQVGNVGAN